MKKVNEITYEKPFAAISITGNRVTVIGEQEVQLDDGRIIEQYVYTIDGHTPENGKPFAALKANIILV